MLLAVRLQEVAHQLKSRNELIHSVERGICRNIPVTFNPLQLRFL